MASIGPVSNAVFANQQTAGVASVQNAQNSRADMQNVMAQAAVNDKDEKVLEVRPAEENHEVDPDREHQKNEADQKNKRNKEDDDKEEKKSSPPLHKLDIKV